MIHFSLLFKTGYLAGYFRNRENIFKCHTWLYCELCSSPKYNFNTSCVSHTELYSCTKTSLTSNLCKNMYAFKYQMFLSHTSLKCIVSQYLFFSYYSDVVRHTWELIRILRFIHQGQNQ